MYRVTSSCSIRVTARDLHASQWKHLHVASVPCRFSGNVATASVSSHWAVVWRLITLSTTNHSSAGSDTATSCCHGNGRARLPHTWTSCQGVIFNYRRNSSLLAGMNAVVGITQNALQPFIHSLIIPNVKLIVNCPFFFSPPHPSTSAT